MRLIGLAERTGSVIQQILYLDSVDRGLGRKQNPYALPGWPPFVRYITFRFVNRGGLA